MFDQPFARPYALHSVDPRARLALAALLALGVSPLRDVTACCLALALGLLLLAAARMPLRPLAQRLAVVNIFVLFLWCVTPLTVPGTPLIQWNTFWGPLAVSHEGVRLTTLVSLKSNAVVCIFLALTAGMTSSTAARALEDLRCPRKLVFLFLFTARHVHLLAQEWRCLHESARLRGFRPSTGMHTYKTLASLLGLLLVRGHERGRRMREAMLLRGFSGTLHALGDFRLRGTDVLFALALLAGLAGILMTEWAGKNHV